MDVNWTEFGDFWKFRGLDLDWVLGSGSGMNAHLSGKGREIDIDVLGEVAVADDVLDRLPEDPFCMNMKSTFQAALAGWFQESQKEFGPDPNQFREPVEKVGGDCKVLESLNWVYNGTVTFQRQNGAFISDDRMIVRDIVLNANEADSVVLKDKGCGEGGGAEPHDALFLALSYLGVEDLLAVERVCRSFRDTVRSDPLLWRNIHIDMPLSERVTDDVLTKLASRAQGSLQCLSLVGCIQVTDDGLKRVLDTNPRLTKLSVPGCLRLSAKGFLSNLRSLKSSGILRLKILRTGGSFGFTNEQFEKLKFLLGVDSQTGPKSGKQRYYGVRQSYLFREDDRAIDIEICPRCEKPGLIYDCPAEACQGKEKQGSPSCRGCIICIERCFNCGCCIKDCEFEETFCLAFSCLVCSNGMLHDKLETDVPASSSSSGTRFPQEMRYQFCFYG